MSSGGGGGSYSTSDLRRDRIPAIRSGVRPVSAKLEWGTIVKTEFGLGYQRMTPYEIQQSVSRLYYVPVIQKPVNSRFQRDEKLKLSRDKLDELSRRLSAVLPGSTADSIRTRKQNGTEKLGVLHSFAWKGWN